jgi:hypothetical protein
VLCLCGPKVLDTKRPITEVDPFQFGELHGFEVSPRSSPMDDLGLVKTIDCFRESVVITVADTPDRRLDARFRQPFGIANGHILRSRSEW